MKNLLNNWLFYGLGREEYRKAIDKIFSKNISGLRRTNGVASILLIGFVIVPLFIDKNLTKACYYIGMGVIAALQYFFIRWKFRRSRREKKINKKLIYTLLFLSYANVISFGIYLGVWANSGKTAGAFLGILICALFLFNIPAVFHLCLTAGSTIIFIVMVFMVKTPAEWSIDIPNALFAGIIGLFFGWHIIMNRLFMASITARIENERNNYYDQSTVDELTQLKNRRDFMNTFQRILASHRSSDNFLCIAILDIDFFKHYNDHYGHLKGDECLSSIGKALKELQKSMNIYAARIGGEEFALLWFEKKAENVQAAASRISMAVRSLNIPHAKSEVAPYVTISIGIYVARCGDSYNINTLYNLADKALYSAKNSGRNHAVITSSLVSLKI
jgi:diguanylate cyclase (GGDEF)-like protein